MVTEPKEVLKRVTASDTATQLDGVRCLKNEIIGNPNRKQCFIQLGAVPKIVRILSQSQEQRLTIQAAAALGSFAYGNEDGVNVIVKSGGVAHLLKTLSSEDNKLVKASLRSLKMIFQESAASPREAVFVSPAFDRLVSFLDRDEQSFAEVSLAILSRCCKTRQHQELLIESGAVPKMINLLFSQKASNQSVAVEGLAKMTNDNDEACSCVVESDEAVKMLIRFCKAQIPEVQFSACVVLTNISTSTVSSVQSTTFNEELILTLVRLLEVPSVFDRVPGIMADLALGRKPLQQLLYDAGVFSKFLKIFEKKQEENWNLELEIGLVKIIGVLCQYLNKCRAELIAYSGIFTFLNGIDSENLEVRSATLFALEALVLESSQQVKEGEEDTYMRKPPMDYSTDPEVKVKELGCVALWLLHTENPAPLIQSPVETMRFLARYSQDADVLIQQKAIWAISNFITSVEDMSHLVMEAVPWSILCDLARDPSHLLQEVGLRWLRGLCERDNCIGGVINWSNGELLPLVSEKLDINGKNTTEILKLAMDIAVSVASSVVSHQTAIMGSEIPPRLLDCLETCESDIVKQRAVECVIKLTYKDVLPSPPEEGEHADMRKMYLLELGFEDTLRKLSESNPTEPLKGKVNEALSNLRRYDS